MSSKLFAFNVSKKREKADIQWIGDPVARADTTIVGYCTGNQDYGIAACDYCLYANACHVYGGGGYSHEMRNELLTCSEQR